jgi:dTDP-4-dehydrorhamnose reductase
VRVALLGANGQLGSDLARALADQDVVPLTRADLDVRDAGHMQAVLGDLGADVVINTTAFHRVEACEQQPDEAFAVNALAPRALARLSCQAGFRFVHVSTDYVFGGSQTRPLTEAVPPAPVQVYGASKAAGEWLVLQANPEALVVRSSGLFGVAGASGKGGNFIETVLRLAREKGTMKIVNDQTLSPTFTRDLAGGIVALIERGARGIVHLTNAGECSWFELAQHVVATARLPAEVHPQSTAESGAPVRRPAYSVLANARLPELGVPRLRPWQEGVTDYLRAKGHAA